MKGFFKWLLEHWYIPVIVLAGVAGWILSGLRSSPMLTVKRELDVIRKGEEARKLMIRQSAVAANAVADMEYRRTLEALNEKQRKKAEELRSDPVRRIRFLRRLSERVGRQAGDHQG